MTVLYRCLCAVIVTGVVGAVAAVLLWCVCSCARRTSLVWQYRLWVITGVLFLLPLRMALPHATPPAAVTTVTVYITETATRPLPSPPTATAPLVAWGDVAAILWLLVVIGLLLYHVLRYVAATSALRRATRVVECRLLADYTARRVQVRQGACVTSPMLLGLFRPTLYLPACNLEERSLRHVLAHETVHLHRGDLWIKRLCLVLRCVQWYNPAAYFVCHRIDATCETSCDVLAIAKCGGDTVAYLSTVLVLLREGRLSSLTTAMVGSSRRIKARFRVVSAYRPRRGVTICAVVVAAVLLTGSLCAGAVYAGNRVVPTSPSVTLPAPSVTVESEETQSPAKEEKPDGMRWPLLQSEGAVSVSFGYGARWGDFHRGVDIVAAMGDPVVAVADGTVIACEGRAYNGGYGMTVTIDHANGLHTRYAHLDSVTVTVGDAVTMGQTIAAVGMTGNVTDPCLHFEVWVNGKTVNPLTYLMVTTDAFPTTETIREGKENTNGE